MEPQTMSDETFFSALCFELDIDPTINDEDTVIQRVIDLKEEIRILELIVKHRLTLTQADVYRWAARPVGVRTNEGRVMVGRGNGYGKAMDALVAKGLCRWDTENPQILRTV